MSLMRLLTVGRSLNEVKGAGRYHIPRQVGLPQFNFGKPTVKFSSPAAAAAVTSGGAVEPAVKPVVVEKTPVAAAAPVAPVAPVPIAAKKETSRGWLKRTNPFAAAAQPAAAAVKPPQQAELTLDQVKVQRNDLADADYEVVPRQELPRQAEIKPYRKRNQPAAVPEDDMLGAKAWNWLGSRLFGAAAKH